MIRKIRSVAQRRGSRRSNSGFSLLELVIVIVIISILLVVAISRLLALQVEAERVAMETVVGVLRSAIGIKVAEHIVRQNVHGLPALEGSNPMDRLAEIPANYLGELDGPDPHSLDNGNWYFDTRSRTLVYQLRHKGFFTGGLGDDPARAGFVIRLIYTDNNRNGVFDRAVDSIEGLRLVAVAPYTWSK